MAKQKYQYTELLDLSETGFTFIMDGAESVRSGRSDRSERSRRSHGSHHHRHHHNARNRGTSSDHGGHRSGMERSMDERSVTIKTPGTMSEADDRMMGEERIEVQVIPQDDNWGDNTTAITGTGLSHFTQGHLYVFWFFFYIFHDDLVKFIQSCM